MKSGIVQIYQQDDNANYQDPTNIPFKLKIPLCLGALISHKHVLTTKLCFGEYLRNVAAKMPYEQQESCHLKLLFSECVGSEDDLIILRCKASGQNCLN